MDGLHQLNLRYESLQDRLLLSIDTAEGEGMRLWMTRRFTRLLSGVLGQAVERGVDELLGGRASAAEPPADSSAALAPDPASRERVKSFQREEALSKVDFGTEYRDRATEHPLGDEPLLVSRIESRPLDGGGLTLTFGVDEHRGVTLNLDRDHLFALLKMVEEGAVVAEWDLIPTGAAESRGVPARGADTVLH